MATWVQRCVWPRHSADVQDAPFHADLAQGPAGGQSVWRTAEDGVKLRLAWWPAATRKGTILLLPGRTEYIEKYGRIATELTLAGYPVMTIDFRGQGLSERLAQDPNLGHVQQFTDYQHDVDCMVALADEVSLPKPWFLIGHSMGGCIGLRALVNGLDVKRAIFSAPMWGIQMPVAFRPLVHTLPPMARAFRFQNRYAPSAKQASYVANAAFEDNALTHDPETFAWMTDHAKKVPEFALAGPSIQWIGEAAAEMSALAKLPRPKLPVMTYLGTEETIVEPGAIRRMHADWPSANLRIVAGARHEFMMEADPIRRQFINDTLAFFGAP